MSKALRHIKTDAELQRVVDRRLSEARGGLGYWAAIDCVNKSIQNRKAMTIAKKKAVKK